MESKTQTADIFKKELYICSETEGKMLERIKLLHTCEFTILTLLLHLSDKVFKVTCPTLQTWRTCPEKGPLNPVTSLPSWDRCNAVLRGRTQNPEILQYTKRYQRPLSPGLQAFPVWKAEVLKATRHAYIPTILLLSPSSYPTHKQRGTLTTTFSLHKDVSNWDLKRSAGNHVAKSRWVRWGLWQTRNTKKPSGFKRRRVFNNLNRAGNQW